MREIRTHIVNPANDQIKITVLDEPGAGGACYEYCVSWPDPTKVEPRHTHISFQNGPIAESGVNGLTQEVLLAIVIDRLQSFQEGALRCRENAIALTKCEEALLWLGKRTRDRMARGVEGTRQI